MPDKFRRAVNETIQIGNVFCCMHLHLILAAFIGKDADF